MGLHGFSSGSFEQLARALSLKILGDGATVFGKGPDGGREASFKGRISFPHPPSDIWDGYGVIQAKFKERVEDTRTEQRWAEQQLKGELRSWERRNTKPQFYIFVTNVELTSGGGGGRERIEELLNAHTPKLLGWRIWDGYQLTAFLDTHEDIRRRFIHHLSSGDIVSEFAKAMFLVGDKNQPSSETTLTTYLARELLSDREARLSQAGNRGEDATSLSSVFLDLPVSEVPQPGEFIPPFPALALLLNASERKLDPLSLQENPVGRKQTDPHPKYIFLGGPGSGKSTLGQYAAQVHRAALLNRIPSHRLEARVKNAVLELKLQCERDNTRWPRTPRYPIRIELRSLAKYLATAQPRRTLSDYIRSRLSNGNYAIKHNDLRGLLAKMPWMLILDGLDEVPSSSNRTEVLNAISDFLIECRDVESDLMIVASSRPDGYSNEFADEEGLQLYLQPLGRELALKCAQKYVSAKFPDGSQRAAEAMQTLRNATASPLISNLMRSPLQVTFMVTVVAASGKPSESRWQLFGDYYRIIYERELQKAVAPFDKVLSERRQDIDALHHRVGFLLQMRGDQLGGTDSELSSDDFRILVKDCLGENGLADDDLNNLAELILAASQQRLVFLTSRTPNRISFDVRSLQEYMAASCIMSDDSEAVVLRLARIAQSAAWRNTALFVVGGLFSEARFRFRRDAVRTICEDLNLEAPEPRDLLPGSRFALEILKSGTTMGVPLATRSLAECALLLLRGPILEGDCVEDLAAVYSDELRTSYEEALSLHLARRPSSETVPSWQLLLLLSHRSVGWAVELVQTLRRKSPADADEIVRAWMKHLSAYRRGFPLSAFERTALTDTVAIGGLEVANDILSTLNPDDGMARSMEAPMNWLMRQPYFDTEAVINGKQCGMSIDWHRLPEDNDLEQFDAAWSTFLERPTASLHRDWAFIKPLRNFYVDPSGATLAATLDVIAECSEEKAREALATYVPWPVAACLRIARTQDELRLVAARLRATGLRRLELWTQTQAALIADESLESLFCASDDRLSIATGYRSIRVTTELDPDTTAGTMRALANHLAASSVGDEPAAAAGLLFYGECNDGFGWAGPESTQKVIHLLSQRRQRSSFGVTPRSFRSAPDAWFLICDRIGSAVGLHDEFVFRDNEELAVNELVEMVGSRPQQSGALVLAALWAARGASVASVPYSIGIMMRDPDPRIRLASLILELSAQSQRTSISEAVIDGLISLIVENNHLIVFELVIGVLEAHWNLGVVSIFIEKAAALPQLQLPGRHEAMRRLALGLSGVRPTGIHESMGSFFRTKSLLKADLS
ncbi:MAG: hypothetical protein Q8N23_24815 [Archangium sp.]|nr:hypothetical protein [Archangium sp.]MDP3570425.1 hypothetical protein [Archangium sp.]